MTDAPETHYTRSADGTNLAYQVSGGGPLDLAFVHGSGIPVDLLSDDPGFIRLRRRLESFSRMVWFDGRGWGASEGDPMDSGPGEMWDTDLTAVLDTVGFERPALVGEGQASEQAIHFSATHPERVSALVLVNGFAHYVREDDYPWGGLGGSRRRRSAVAQISSERDLIDLCQRLRRGLERARDQLEQSPDANISPRLSDALDDVIDVAQDCRKYGLD